MTSLLGEVKSTKLASDSKHKRSSEERFCCFIREVFLHARMQCSNDNSAMRSVVRLKKDEQRGLDLLPALLV